MRVPRRLVDVEVDGDQKVQAGERLVELRRIRGAAHRIGHQQDHRPHLAVARRQHLLRHRRGGNHAADFRLAADAALPAPERDSLPLRQRRFDRRRRRGEHDAAGAVEIAGEQVDEIAAPTRQRAELLHARAEAAVTRRRRRRGELARDAPDLRGGNAAVIGDRLRRELLSHPAHVVEPADEPLGGSEIDQVFGEQCVHQREQKRRIGGGTDEVVLAGNLRRFGGADR